MTPNEIEMNERKAILNKILIDAKNNDNIDTATTIELFKTFVTELEIYKYSGITDQIYSVLENEYNNNTHGFQAFLQHMLIEPPINIYQYLINTII